MLIRRLFGGYDPTHHSTVVKNYREKIKDAADNKNPTHRDVVIWR